VNLRFRFQIYPISFCELRKNITFVKIFLTKINSSEMRKQRTRQHIIEDLSFNHIEKQILLAGFTMNRNSNDYGIDGYIQTFLPTGEIYKKTIDFQLKSTDYIQYTEKRQALAFDLNIVDLEFWLSKDRQMLLILYDAQKDIAYYIDLAIYFEKNRKSLAEINKFVCVYLPVHQIFNPQAVIALR
jgi:Domain of unknown function (DUF4365)